MATGVCIRKYSESDIAQVVDVFRESVKQTGPQGYNRLQVKIWSSYPDNIEDFSRLLDEGVTYVAEAQDRLVAFGTLNPLDHLAFIYTLKQYSGKGLAQSIYWKLEEHAAQSGIDTISTEASIIAKSFFEKVGFEMIETEVVLRKGVEFVRFKMRKTLTGYKRASENKNF